MLHHVCSAATQLKLKEFLSNLDSLSQSILPNIAADLMAAFSGVRAELRVKSLACKIHNVRVPDQPFMDRLLAVLDDSSSWPSRLFHACLVHGALQAPALDAEGTSVTHHHHSHHHSHDNTDGGDMRLCSPTMRPLLASRLLIVQEAMSDAPMAATCTVAPHTKDDDAYLTAWRINAHRLPHHAHSGVEVCQSICRAIELLRSESWSASAHFVTQYCDQNGVVDLARFFRNSDRSGSTCSEADEWAEAARRVLSPFSAQLRLHLNPASNGIRAEDGEQVVLLVSWGRRFHRLAEGVVRRILARASCLSAADSAGQCVILYSNRAAWLLSHFTPEAAQAISALAGGHWSELNIVLQRIDAKWEHACREEGGDGQRAVTSVDFLSGVGFSGPLLENRLLPLARQLDLFGSPGYTMCDIARWAVLQLAFPVCGPYIGEDVQVGETAPRPTDANGERTVMVSKVR